MKLLMPVAIAFLGLGAGVGAGIALKPAPEEHAAAPDCATAEAGDHAPAAEDHASPDAAVPADCASTAEGQDPFAPVQPPKPEHKGETANVALDKPFVVPVFEADEVEAMVVSSVAIELAAEGVPMVEGYQPRLRDSFLAVMFRHANSGGFDGTFTEGRKMDDLRSALLQAAQGVFGEVPVYEVLITDIARQDL